MNDDQSFRELDVWQEAMTLVEEIYIQSRRFPADEPFGPKANLNHLEIALGSQGEVDVQFEIAFRLGYCERADYERIQTRVSRIGRMLNGLIASVKQRAGESQSQPPTTNHHPDLP